MEYVKVAHLKEGDVVAKTIYNDKLQVLLREGGTLTKAGILNIRNQGYKGCYIEHDGSERREDVPVLEPLIDEVAELIIIKQLKELFNNKLIWTDPINISFKKQRADIDSIVCELTNGIYDYNRDDKLLYETEDSMRTYKNWLYHHSLATCVIAIGICAKMGIDRPTAVDIGIGAIYHDLGKAYLGEDLYNKEDPTPEEKLMLRNHPERMFRILQRLNYPINTTYAVWQHHEKMDGSGYPHGIDGSKITLAAQIVSLASAFDNLVSIKAYDSHPLSQNEALEYLQGCGLYSIDCIRALLQFVVPFPIGSKVALSNGKQGIVLKNVPSVVLRPYVLVGSELYDLCNSPSYRNVTILGEIKEDVSL